MYRLRDSHIKNTDEERRVEVVRYTVHRTDSCSTRRDGSQPLGLGDRGCVGPRPRGQHSLHANMRKLDSSCTAGLCICSPSCIHHLHCKHYILWHTQPNIGVYVWYYIYSCYGRLGCESVAGKSQGLPIYKTGG